MRTIYFECNAGASGDMIVGSLVGLLDDPYEFESMISAAGIPGTNVTIEKTQRSEIQGFKVHVTIDGDEEGHPCGHHHGRHLSDVIGIINGLHISDEAKKHACEIYRLIAESEAEVHGKPVDLVHFHEVGALDAVADVVCACLLIEKLSPGTIISSPVRTGFGQTRCAHGCIPVPAPATALLLRGVPAYAGDIEGEFTTPTGAAILKHFVSKFERMPVMVSERIGTGLGDKEFPIANVLRATLGDSEDSPSEYDEITCNLDDITPEDAAPIISILLKNGAKDAMLKTCLMKKGRIGLELTCLCWHCDLDRMIDLILSNTTTIGVRVHKCLGYAMNSRFETRHTPYGDIRMKISEGLGHTRVKPEFEDLRKAAEEHNVSIETVRKSL